MVLVLRFHSCICSSCCSFPCCTFIAIVRGIHVFVVIDVAPVNFVVGGAAAIAVAVLVVVARYSLTTLTSQFSTASLPRVCFEDARETMKTCTSTKTCWQVNWLYWQRTGVDRTTYWHQTWQLTHLELAAQMLVEDTRR